MNFIKQNNLVFNQSKTLAELIRYDQKVIGDQSTVQFFSGDFIAGNTNLLNSYIPPESEHQVIWGIRVLSTGAVEDPVYLSTWIESHCLSLLSGQETRTFRVL